MLIFSVFIMKVRTDFVLLPFPDLVAVKEDGDPGAERIE
jgi:hypothetical protein